MFVEKSVIRTEAIFSDDRTHRYLLHKEWDSKKPKATIIMTNPNTAGIVALDFTTLYIMHNIIQLDFGFIDIVNLTSKTTRKLDVVKDLSLEEENLSYILKSAEKSSKIIIAWGKLGENNAKVRAVQKTLIEKLKPYADRLCEIGNEAGESGFHPLAPQIRFEWVLRQYEPFVEPEKVQRVPERKPTVSKLKVKKIQETTVIAATQTAKAPQDKAEVKASQESLEVKDVGEEDLVIL